MPLLHYILHLVPPNEQWWSFVQYCNLIALPPVTTEVRQSECISSLWWRWHEEEVSFNLINIQYKKLIFILTHKSGASFSSAVLKMQSCRPCVSVSRYGLLLYNSIHINNNLAKDKLVRKNKTMQKGFPNYISQHGHQMPDNVALREWNDLYWHIKFPYLGFWVIPFL